MAKAGPFTEQSLIYTSFNMLSNLLYMKRHQKCFKIGCKWSNLVNNMYTSTVLYNMFYLFYIWFWTFFTCTEMRRARKKDKIYIKRLKMVKSIIINKYICWTTCLYLLYALKLAFNVRFDLLTCFDLFNMI